jgi:hypothetical protein
MMKPTKLPFLFAAVLLLSAPLASAFPRTKERATLTLSFTLAPPVGSVSTASGSATLDLTRHNGVATVGDLQLTLAGLTTGTYTVAAVQASDGASVTIGTVAFDSSAPPGAPAALVLPAELDPLDIALLTVSDSTPVVVLEGAPVESIDRWIFSANVRITAPPGAQPIPPLHGKGKPKKVHGHVVVHAAIVNDVEKRRKFLLVAHGGPADTELTINLDGEPVGTVITTPRGKVMVKRLDGDFRLAGIGELTLTDAEGNVLMEADFFPGID